MLPCARCFAWLPLRSLSWHQGEQQKKKTRRAYAAQDHK